LEILFHLNDPQFSLLMTDGVRFFSLHQLLSMLENYLLFLLYFLLIKDYNAAWEASAKMRFTKLGR